MKSHEFERQPGELLEVKVESSRKMRDREKEDLVKDGIRRGFSKELYMPTPLSWSVGVDVRRVGLTPGRGINWFDMEPPEINESERMIRFRIRLDLKRVNDDLLVKDGKLDEGEVGEVIGFFFKTWALRYEVVEGERERDLLFLGKQISEYKVENGYDELWYRVKGFYIMGELRSDWKWKWDESIGQGEE
jgi:hypothetical protein